MRSQKKKRAVENPLGLAVLALLFERPMHPYEMATLLRARHKEESIKLNYGSLYTVIAALTNAGYIAVRDTRRDTARPERTTYVLTEAGETELRDWLSGLLSTPVKEYLQFEAALSLMPVLPPREVASLLLQRGAALDAEIALARAKLDALQQKGLERLFLIEEEYQLAMREAERTWVSGLAELIRTSPRFTKTWRALQRSARKPSIPT